MITPGPACVIGFLSGCVFCWFVRRIGTMLMSSAV